MVYNSLMLYKFFTNSETAWRAMFEAMSLAQEFIYLEMYIFADDIREFNFLKLLKEKAKNGVKVKIILDSFGSAELSNKVISDLKEAGVEIIFFSYFLHRTHRKVLIVDGKVAFVGGVNLQQNMHKWIDMVVQVKGRLVRSVIKSFAKAYVLSGGKDPVLVSLKKKIVSFKARSWLLEHFPVSNKFRLRKLYREAFKNVEKKIVMVSPYFMPKPWFINAMHECVHRGVKIDVIIPKATESFFVDRVNYFYIYKMSKLGVNVYLEPQMNHAKVLVVDENEGMIGSNNLDVFSFELNSEIGVFIKDNEAISRVLRIINNWEKESVLFDLKSYKPKWFDYVLSPLIRLLFFI